VVIEFFFAKINFFSLKKDNNLNKLSIFETEETHKTKKKMKKFLLLSFTLLAYLGASAQNEDCFKRLEDAFTKRGSYTISDDMHRNVIISFFDSEGSSCVSGKARVENGVIVSIFLQYKDDTYELMDKKFYNAKKTPPTITNGISEMIFTPDGEKFRVVFIDKLKPKAKSYKNVEIPTDL
jgi:hypothetical protein